MKLLKADLNIKDQARCNETYGKFSQLPEGIIKGQICARSEDAEARDACQNDSGGPLTIETNGKVTLVGVISFGYKCAIKGYPDVQHYIKWILENL